MGSDAILTQLRRQLGRLIGADDKTSSEDAVPLVDNGERRPRQKILRHYGPFKENEFPDVHRFGPLFARDPAPQSAYQDYKEKAWLYVKQNSRGDDPSEIEENFRSSIGGVLEMAREAYSAEDIKDVVGNDNELKQMMLRDGCFFLILAISTLGGPSVFRGDTASTGGDGDGAEGGGGEGFSEYVLDNIDRIQTRTRVKSMYYTGNQIPLVVLQKLTEQQYFRDKIRRLTPPEPPADLFRRVLYEFLSTTDPSRRESRKCCCCCCCCWLPCSALLPSEQQHEDYEPETPTDLLQSLYLTVAGNAVNRRVNGTVIPDGDDLESGRRDDDDDGDYADPDDHEDKEFPSATELKQLGIRFKKIKNANNGGGFRSICITHNWLVGASLCLPPFTVNYNTEILFECLKSYEMLHQPENRKRELGAYLRLMSELIRTTDDVRILASAGLILGKPIYKEKLPALLSRLAQGESNHNLLNLRLQINEYSRPGWGKLKGYISIVVLLTLVQTIFSVLAYVNDLKS